MILLRRILLLRVAKKPIDRHRRDLPSDVVATVMRLVGRRPDQRIDSARTLLRELIRPAFDDASPPRLIRDDCTL